MNTNRRYPRFAARRLKEALADTPVVLIHGPRQCGKTTLARLVGYPLGYSYFSFDDPVLISAAESDPIGFVDGLPNHTILDEVQRAPSLFSALKMAVNRRRVPGRFLLTGSANVMLLPKLSESLAGRIGIIQLHPLARCELAGKESHFLDALFAGSFKTQKFERLGKALAEFVADGGYPAALARPNPRRRADPFVVGDCMSPRKTKSALLRLEANVPESLTVFDFPAAPRRRMRTSHLLGANSIKPVR